jgi:hypothetical protein
VHRIRFRLPRYCTTPRSWESGTGRDERLGKTPDAGDGSAEGWQLSDLGKGGEGKIVVQSATCLGPL